MANNDKKPDTKGRVRKQFDFAPEAYARLNELRDETEARSLAEVIRRALIVYEWFLAKVKDGNTVQIVKDGEVKQVDILL